MFSLGYICDPVAEQETWGGYGEGWFSYSWNDSTHSFSQSYGGNLDSGSWCGTWPHVMDYWE